MRPARGGGIKYVCKFPDCAIDWESVLESYADDRNIFSSHQVCYWTFLSASPLAASATRDKCSQTRGATQEETPITTSRNNSTGTVLRGMAPHSRGSSMILN